MEQSKKFKNDKNFKGSRKKKGRTYDETSKIESCDGITSNDISWYNKYPDLFDDVTRVPFNKVAGYEYFIGGNVNVALTPTETGGSTSVPSVMRINYIPTVGISRNYTSAINKAFQSLWSAIYSKTTGILQFPQYILGLQVMAGQSIAQNIALIKRALATSYLYVARNANYPKLLLEAMGIWPDSVIGHQDEVRIKVNDLIRSFNSLCIPDFIDSFKRHYSLCHNVWKDGVDVSTPTYIFMPATYYIYSDLGAGSSIEDVDGKARTMSFFMPNYQDRVTIDDLCQVVEDQIEALRSSHDFQSILGSLQRAFDGNAFIHISEAQVDEFLVPVYDEIILNQIRNMTPVGNDISVTRDVAKTLPSYVIELSQDTAPGYSWDITGDPITNTLKFEPLMEATCVNACYLGDDGVGRNVLRFKDRSAIHPNNIMECTRLMTYVDGATPAYDYKWQDGALILDGTSDCRPIDSCGLEVVLTAEMYWKESEGTTVQTEIRTAVDMAVSSNDRSMKMLAYASQFWYAPLIYLCTGFDNYGYGMPIGELDHWTFVDRSTLEGLHMAANLSVFRATSSLPVRN